MPEVQNPWEGMPPLDAAERRKRRREALLIGLLGAAFIALTVAELQLAKISSTLPFVNSIFFFGLLNANLIILIALVWLIFRNIGKLFLERRRRVLGARLKTKLVLAFLAFSIIPTLLLFVISATYINSSFDKWFSIKVQNTLQASLEITHSFYRNADHTARHFADHIAEGIGRRMPVPPPVVPDDADGPKGYVSVSRPAPRWVPEFLTSERELLALDAVEYYSDPLDERVLERRNDGAESYPRLALDKLEQAFAGERISVFQRVGSGDLIRSLVPVRAAGREGYPVVGVVAVDSFIPVSIMNKADEINNVLDDYKETNPLKYPMKTMYLAILVMITLVIMFVAIWIGLYLARELTVPVERLVHGAQEVGSGNLDVTITSSGHDEIAVLVESFNKMTSDLRENRTRLLQAGADLEKRRLQLEAILANVGTGVVAVDADGAVTTLNRAAADLLGLDAKEAAGRDFREVIASRSAPLAALVDGALHAGGRGPESAQWNQPAGGRSNEEARALTAVATPLRDTASGKGNWGAVVVIDDMTHLIKGQREMAWREVARRIAHEIKNPLTPIKLSAQRLQRRMGEMRGRDGAVLRECTDTIIKHTDELKEMVNEFSNFARFPEASPAPHDLNAAVSEVVSLFHQAHSGIQLQFRSEARLPIFDFDRDQMKRVLINLLDNAVSALGANLGRARQVRVTTHYNDQLQMAVIEVEDNGPGMDEGVKARLFEPYFSTKEGGTGLGLAIVKRIVNDHNGFIRVNSAPGEGTRFWVELPIARKRAELRLGVEGMA